MPDITHGTLVFKTNVKFDDWLEFWSQDAGWLLCNAPSLSFLLACAQGKWLPSRFRKQCPVQSFRVWWLIVVFVPPHLYNLPACDCAWLLRCMGWRAAKQHPPCRRTAGSCGARWLEACVQDWLPWIEGDASLLSFAWGCCLRGAWTFIAVFVARHGAPLQPRLCRDRSFELKLPSFLECWVVGRSGRRRR